MLRRSVIRITMYYYDPNDRRPVRWAAIMTTVYVVAVAAAFLLVRFRTMAERPVFTGMEVEFIEPEPEPQPEPPRPQAAEPRAHDVVSPENNERQASGSDEQTRTVNPRALFRQPTGGVDEPDNAGNPRAAEAEQDSARGTGGGLNPDGNDRLDSGLQGRGLVGTLPEPSCPVNRNGKIVIRVTVDGSGRVVNAVYEPKGSTLNDGSMIQASIEAAYKARFTESRAIEEGGTITYYFNLK